MCLGGAPGRGCSWRCTFRVISRWLGFEAIERNEDPQEESVDRKGNDLRLSPGAHQHLELLGGWG